MGKNEKCNAEGHCVKSSPFGDPDKMRSKEAACRTVPDALVNNDNDNFKFSKKKCSLRMVFVASAAIRMKFAATLSLKMTTLSGRAHPLCAAAVPNDSDSRKRNNPYNSTLYI